MVKLEKKHCYTGLAYSLLFVLAVVFLTLISPHQVEATLTEDQLVDYSLSHILFYDPNSCGTTPVSNGIFKGTPFTGMDDNNLAHFAAAAASEQSGFEAFKFELSLIANLYDENCAKYNSDCNYTAASLGNYILNGRDGWFHSNTKQAYRTGTPAYGNAITKEYIDAAKDILVNGNRTAPHGINEHDGVGEYSIVYSPTSNTDPYDAANYVSGQTKIDNQYGASYTFYSWCDGEKSKTGRVTTSCDPFGYIHEINESGSGSPERSYSTTTTAGDNKLYNGKDVLTPAQLQQIEKNKPTYQKIAEKYNFPWQLLAALHYREHSLAVDNPANGEGMYQLTTLTNHGSNEKAFKPAGPVDQVEFERQTELAAQVIRNKIGVDTDLMNNDDNVKRVMFMYNWANQVYIDRAIKMGFTEEQAKNGEGSPYVMNMADAKRDPGNASVSPEWKGLIANLKGDVVPDTRPGAFVVFQALGGGNGNDSCSNSGGNGDIARTAIELSWEGKERGNCSSSGCDPKPEYVKAMDEVGTTTDMYQGGNYIGASCDQFVTTVMRYSKVDPEYPLYIAEALEHMKNSDKYQEILYNGDDLYSKLQPGDIFIFDNSGTGVAHGHIFIYVELNGKQGQASASAKGRSAQHFPSIYYSDMGGARKYRVFRRIK